MKNSKYLKKLITLGDELERTGKANPFDPDAHNDIVDQLNSLGPPPDRHKRRRPWGMIYLIIVLLLILTWIVLEVLIVFDHGGPQ